MKRHYLFIIPVVLFIFLACIESIHGARFRSSEICAELWQKKQWQEIAALADNLGQLGMADPKTLCVAMIASQQIHNAQAANKFADRLVHSRFINWRIESQLARTYSPGGFLNLLRLRRTGIAFSLLTALVAVNALSVRRHSISWSAAIISSVGCLLLLL